MFNDTLTDGDGALDMFDEFAWAEERAALLLGVLPQDLIDWAAGLGTRSVLDDVTIGEG